MPLACSGLACSAATDDNAVVTGLSSTLQTSSYTQVFQDRSADLFNRRFDSGFSMMATTGSAAAVLHGSYEASYNHYGVTIHGFDLTNTVQNYGARCGVKLGEDNQDTFTAPEYD
jgi:hypothetical protein